MEPVSIVVRLDVLKDLVLGLLACGKAFDAEILQENIRLGNVSLGSTAGAAWEGVKGFGNALVKPISEAWDRGDRVESVTRGVLEVATLPVAWIKGTKVGKLGKLGQGGKAASHADDLAQAQKAAEVASDAKKGVHVKPKPYANPKNRPKYTKNQVDKVWENAKSPDGKVYDPNTGAELQWDWTKSRAGQWDMGHMPGDEYRKLHQRYMSGEISKSEFLKQYSDPVNYRPESVSTNRWHKHEVDLFNEDARCFLICLNM